MRLRAWHAVSSTHSDHLHIQVAALVEAGNSSSRKEDAQAAQLLKMLDHALLALDDVSLQPCLVSSSLLPYTYGYCSAETHQVC